MDLLFVLLFSSLFLCSDDLEILGSSAPLTGKLGGSVLLPCSIRSPPPLQEVEVEWRRPESGILVNLWQNGESQLDSVDQEYRDRVQFFSQEIPHGNFSILITNVSRHDVGFYRCGVFTNQESGGTQIEIQEVEWLIVTGGGAVSSHVGGDVTLNCSVDSPISSEKINQVQWKKVSGDVLVLLFEDGEVHPDSTDESYRGRVQLFSSEETSKGNFSLRLKNIRAEDRGAYSCEVYSGDFSNSTTVELHKLGVSTLHIRMCVLCGGSVMSLLISFLVYKGFIQTEDNWRIWVLISTLVVLPNVLLAAAFIFWGQRDGSTSETLTCSALNLLRILFLIWISPYFRQFKAIVQNLMNMLVIMLLFIIFTVIIFIDINATLADKVSTEAETANTMWQGIQFLLMFIFYFFDFFYLLISEHLNGANEVYDDDHWFYDPFWSSFTNMFRFTEFFSWMRIIYIIQLLDPNPAFFSILLISLLPITWFNFKIKIKKLIWISGLLLWMIISTPVMLYLHYHFLEKIKERTALILITAFLQVLNILGMFQNYYPLSAGTHLVVWFWGSVVVVCVNAAALITELILTALNGEPTKHLRIILLISETLFTLIWLILRIIRFYNRKRIKVKSHLEISLDSVPELSEPLNHLNHLMSVNQLSDQIIRRRRRSSFP